MPPHPRLPTLGGLAALALGLAACQPAAPPAAGPGSAAPTALAPGPAGTGQLAESKTLYVGPERVDCSGVAPMRCLQVKEDPDGEWQLFYGDIEGFEHEPGYTYTLRVAVSPVANPPADGSSLRYVLVEVVSKTAAPATP